MSDKLLGRLEDIPGVVAVSIDIEEPDGGINVRLAPDADEAEVMERVRALLVAYGVRSQGSPAVMVGETHLAAEKGMGVDVRITPIKGGARVEVIGSTIRSFRVVPPMPAAVAQGLADAWSQVLGRSPMEIVEVAISPDAELQVVAADSHTRRTGSARLARGWLYALAHAVGDAIGVGEAETEAIDARMPETAW